MGNKMNLESMIKDKLVISSALWIKKNAHALRVIAGVFFH